MLIVDTRMGFTGIGRIGQDRVGERATRGQGRRGPGPSSFKARMRLVRAALKSGSSSGFQKMCG